MYSAYNLQLNYLANDGVSGKIQTIIANLQALDKFAKATLRTIKAIFSARSISDIKTSITSLKNQLKLLAKIPKTVHTNLKKIGLGIPVQRTINSLKSIERRLTSIIGLSNQAKLSMGAVGTGVRVAGMPAVRGVNTTIPPVVPTATKPSTPRDTGRPMGQARSNFFDVWWTTMVALAPPVYVTKKYMEYEDALAKIKRASEATDAQMKVIDQQLRQIDIAPMEVLGDVANEVIKQGFTIKELPKMVRLILESSEALDLDKNTVAEALSRIVKITNPQGISSEDTISSAKAWMDRIAYLENKLPLVKSQPMVKLVNKLAMDTKMRKYTADETAALSAFLLQRWETPERAHQAYLMIQRGISYMKDPTFWREKVKHGGVKGLSEVVDQLFQLDETVLKELGLHSRRVTQIKRFGFGESSKTIDEILKLLGDAEGTVDQEVARWLATLRAKFKIAGKETDDTTSVLGEALRPTVENLLGLTKLFEPIEKFVTKHMGVFQVIFGVLSAFILSGLIIAIGTLIVKIGVATLIFSKLTIGLGLLLVAIMAIVHYWDDVKRYWNILMGNPVQPKKPVYFVDFGKKNIELTERQKILAKARGVDLSDTKAMEWPEANEKNTLEVNVKANTDTEVTHTQEKTRGESSIFNKRTTTSVGDSFMNVWNSLTESFN